MEDVTVVFNNGNIVSFVAQHHSRSQKPPRRPRSSRVGVSLTPLRERQRRVASGGGSGGGCSVASRNTGSL
jgi:hypothetical protein